MVRTPGFHPAHPDPMLRQKTKISLQNCSLLFPSSVLSICILLRNHHHHPSPELFMLQNLGGHMVILCLIFLQTPILFSTVAAPIYIPTSSIKVLQFVHILASTFSSLFFFLTVAVLMGMSLDFLNLQDTERKKLSSGKRTQRH